MKSREIRLVAYNEVLTFLQCCCSGIFPVIPDEGECKPIVTDWEEDYLNGNPDFVVSATKTVTLPVIGMFRNKHISFKAIVYVWAMLYDDWSKKATIYKDDNYIYGYNNYPKLELVNDMWSYVITIIRLKAFKD